MATAAVNKPTDTKQKEKDVNAKLQLYGIYAGMSSPLVLLAYLLALGRESRPLCIPLTRIS